MPRQLMQIAPAVMGLLLGLVATQPLLAAPDCWQLREQRDRLGVQAMQAEIALVISLRRQLCPREEAAAERAHAGEGSPEAATEETSTGLRYEAYIHCRQQAELRLRRSQPVLFRNGRGFVFYTEAGARLARAAEALQPRIDASCPPPSLPNGPRLSPTPTPGFQSEPGASAPPQPPQRP